MSGLPQDPRALIVRPVNSNSEARPCPITRGSIAHAPMSQPASPTRVNKNAVFACGVPKRMSQNSAIIAPAPTQTPSTAAMTGCGQARMAFTRSPVIRVNSSRPFMSLSRSGPIFSRKSIADSCAVAITSGLSCAAATTAAAVASGVALSGIPSACCALSMTAFATPSPTVGSPVFAALFTFSAM